jgi:hypothetical protein
MIDYYYEFDAEKHTGGYGFFRGFHPDQATEFQNLLHSYCWNQSHRVWLENANGAILVKSGSREVHERVQPWEAPALAWIKLQARNVEQ